MNINRTSMVVVRCAFLKKTGNLSKYSLFACSNGFEESVSISIHGYISNTTKEKRINAAKKNTISFFMLI